MSRWGQHGARLEPELTALRDSIRQRGRPDLSGASRAVADYLAGVVRDAGAAGDPGAHRWARDRLRLFMVVSWANWFGLLERLPDEYPVLRREWQELVSYPDRSGPEHLVAWWWQLQPAMFQPLVANQLREMHPPLRDGVAGILRGDGDFAAHLVNWPEFVGSKG